MQRRRLRSLAGLLVLLVAAAADATPVRYSVRGTLRTQVGSDPLSLDGAHLEIVVDADTSAPPHSITFFSGTTRADYLATARAAITQRPGGALDQSIVYSTTLLTLNCHSLGDCPDRFLITGFPAIMFEGATIRMAGADWHFDKSFFGGTGAARLPMFDESDVVEVSGVPLTTDPGAVLYSFSVPEPAAALLLASGLLALGLTRSKRNAAQP